MLKMKRYAGLWLLVVMLASACSGRLPASADARTPDAETPNLSAPNPAPTEMTRPQLEGADAVVTDLRARVAAQLDVAPEELEVVAMSQETWRDASLGCPEPGKMYAQVIVEGWRVVFATPSGEEYEVHTGDKLERYVICDAASPTSESEDAGMAPSQESLDSPAVMEAVSVLTRRLDVDADAVTVVAVEEVQWRNSCLGCASKGQACLMVITPGYRVTLRSAGETYEVHTNRDGSRALICDG